jgi:hypothetical protein
MTPHHITKTFKGSQTGHDHDEFVAGTVRGLSRDLAAIAVKQGWAVPVEAEIPPRALADGEAPQAADRPEVTSASDEKALAAAPENTMKKPVKGKK